METKVSAGALEQSGRSYPGWGGGLKCTPPTPATRALVSKAPPPSAGRTVHGRLKSQKTAPPTTTCPRRPCVAVAASRSPPRQAWPPSRRGAKPLVPALSWCRCGQLTWSARAGGGDAAVAVRQKIPLHPGAGACAQHGVAGTHARSARLADAVWARRAAGGGGGGTVWAIAVESCEIRHDRLVTPSRWGARRAAVVAARWPRRQSRGRQRGRAATARAALRGAAQSMGSGIARPTAYTAPAEDAGRCQAEYSGGEYSPANSPAVARQDPQAKNAVRCRASPRRAGEGGHPPADSTPPSSPQHRQRRGEQRPVPRGICRGAPWRRAGGRSRRSGASRRGAGCRRGRDRGLQTPTGAGRPFLGTVLPSNSPPPDGLAE